MLKFRPPSLCTCAEEQLPSMRAPALRFESRYARLRLHIGIPILLGRRGKFATRSRLSLLKPSPRQAIPASRGQTKEVYCKPSLRMEYRKYGIKTRSCFADITERVAPRRAPTGCGGPAREPGWRRAEGRHEQAKQASRLSTASRATATLTTSLDRLPSCIAASVQEDESVRAHARS